MEGPFAADAGSGCLSVELGEEGGEDGPAGVPEPWGAGAHC